MTSSKTSDRANHEMSLSDLDHVAAGGRGTAALIGAAVVASPFVTAAAAVTAAGAAAAYWGAWAAWG
jgi:hypothetical protein